MSSRQIRRLDAEPLLFIHGLVDQIIKRGGVKVEPTKSTWILCKLPAGLEAGLAAIKDALFNYQRCALYSLERYIELKLGDALPNNPSMRVRFADLPTLFV